MHRTDELAGDTGSVIYGEEAVALGLIDRVGTLADALGELHRMIEGDGKKKCYHPWNEGNRP